MYPAHVYYQLQSDIHLARGRQVAFLPSSLLAFDGDRGHQSKAARVLAKAHPQKNNVIYSLLRCSPTRMHNLKYLARYLIGGPISDRRFHWSGASRLVRLDGIGLMLAKQGKSAFSSVVGIGIPRPVRSLRMNGSKSARHNPCQAIHRNCDAELQMKGCCQKGNSAAKLERAVASGLGRVRTARQGESV